MDVIPGYTFDDVLLIPKKSNIESREDIDLSVKFRKGIELKIPIISANMKNVTGPKMAQKIAKLGGMAILHRFVDGLYDFVKQYTDSLVMPEDVNHIGVSVGIHDYDKKLVEHAVGAGCKIICVDVAHGHHDNCLRMCEYIAGNFPDVLLIAGNISTAEGALDLVNVGADVIKGGVGSGSLCSTRIETGNGVPQLTALDNIYQVLKNTDVVIVSDGGVKVAGDLTKCLVFSHAVMLGNLLAGTDEAPGEIIQVDGLEFKQYAGSSTHKSKHIEGVIGLVPYRGPVEKVITKLMEGLQSGCSYQGAKNLIELRKDPKFVSISNAGLIESKPHDVRY